MKLYNTLKRQLQDIQPLHDDQIGIYTCGPTVYDHIHIGNLSSFIFADTLRRVLAANNYQVHHVINFTDVDDKTIRRSQESYPELEPHKALKKLTDEYGNLFLQDMTAVGNEVGAYDFVKAADHIDEMQRLIKQLLNDGFAYIADDGIYFSIDAYKRAGKKYGQLSSVTADSTSSQRIQNDEYDKETAHDFALWKVQKPNEPAWDFEIDGQDRRGRPGWHIECSAMSRQRLGQPFDIHTGGVDLIFPHHENEIAQSTAAGGDIYAAVFAHNEHLLVDGQKMSKSLNNFFTLDDIRDKGFEPLAFRLLVLQAHYKSQANFSWQNLQAAQNRLHDFRALAALRWQPRRVTHDTATFALRDVVPNMLELLSNDLDTPKALAFLSQASTQLQTVHIEQDMVDHFEDMLAGIDSLLGLDLLSVADINDEQKELIKRREAARANQDWSTSDTIRDQLQTQGIGLHDASHGVIWFPL